MALVGALAAFVVDPDIDDGLAGGVEAEEQPVLLEELGAEPVFVAVAEGVALAVFGAGGVLRDDLKRELPDGGEAFGGVLLQVSLGVFALEFGDLGCERVELLGEQGVGKQRPAVDDDGRRGHSSSAESGASRSTDTLNAWPSIGVTLTL